MPARKVAVIGMGQFGMAIAKSLSRRGAEVMVIDKDEHLIEEMADQVDFAVALDASDRKAIVSQGIMDFDAVVVAIGEDFEQLLLCTTLLLDLGIKQVVARARGSNQRTILEKIGVKEILLPEDEVGINVAERLINPGIVSFFKLPDDFGIIEIITPPAVIGRSLVDLDLRRRYELNLITIKRERKADPQDSGTQKKENKPKREKEIEDEEENTEPKPEEKPKQHITGIPHGDTVIEENDALVLFGKKTSVERFIEVNQ